MRGIPAMFGADQNALNGFKANARALGLTDAETGDYKWGGDIKDRSRPEVTIEHLSKPMDDGSRPNQEIVSDRLKQIMRFPTAAIKAATIGLPIAELDLDRHTLGLPAAEGRRSPTELDAEMAEDEKRHKWSDNEVGRLTIAVLEAPLPEGTTPEQKTAILTERFQGIKRLSPSAIEAVGLMGLPRQDVDEHDFGDVYGGQEFDDYRHESITVSLDFLKAPLPEGISPAQRMATLRGRMARIKRHTSVEICNMQAADIGVPAEQLANINWGRNMYGNDGVNAPYILKILKAPHSEVALLTPDILVARLRGMEGVGPFQIYGICEAVERGLTPEQLLTGHDWANHGDVTSRYLKSPLLHNKPQEGVEPTKETLLDRMNRVRGTTGEQIKAILTKEKIGFRHGAIAGMISSKTPQDVGALIGSLVGLDSANNGGVYTQIRPVNRQSRVEAGTIGGHDGRVMAEKIRAQQRAPRAGAKRSREQAGVAGQEEAAQTRVEQVRAQQRAPRGGAGADPHER